MSTHPTAQAFYRCLDHVLAELEAPEYRSNSEATSAIRYFTSLLFRMLDGTPAPRPVVKAAVYAASTAGLEGETFREYRGYVRILLEHPAALLMELKRNDPARSSRYVAATEYLDQLAA